MTAPEYAVKVVAVIIIAVGSIGAELVLLPTPPELVAAFVVLLASVAAVGPGATLMTLDTLPGGCSRLQLFIDPRCQIGRRNNASGGRGVFAPAVPRET